MKLIIRYPDLYKKHGQDKYNFLQSIIRKIDGDTYGFLDYLKRPGANSKSDLIYICLRFGPFTLGSLCAAIDFPRQKASSIVRYFEKKGDVRKGERVKCEFSGRLAYTYTTFQEKPIAKWQQPVISFQSNKIPTQCIRANQI